MATLLLFSSNFGLSQRICERIAERLVVAGERAQVAPLAAGVDPAGFDAVVIGASIKHGKHHPSVLEFIRRHQVALSERPSALFSVNLVARKPAKRTPQTNPYLKALLAQSPWTPGLLGVFAGELDYARYGPVDKQMMRFVMWINGGPTDPSTRKQFTDWDEVDRFAERVLQLTAALRASTPAATPVSAPVVEADALPA